MRMIASVLPVFLAACATPTGALNGLGPDASEVLFVGILEKLVLRRNTASDSVRREGDRIIVSNSCGASEATFRVVRSSAPLSGSVTITSRLSEWCDPPVPFEARAWLLVFDGDEGEYVGFYPLLDVAGRAFAMQENDEYTFANYSPALRQMLASELLSGPVRYPLIRSNSRSIDPQWVAWQPDIEMTQDGLVVTRGVPVDVIFPGFTFEELRR